MNSMGRTSPSLTKLVKAAEKDELNDGKGKVVTVAGRTIALFRVKNEYYALNNGCIHRGGPLGEGELVDHQVTCPWHGWKYDVRDGSFAVIPTLKVKTYKVTEKSEGIFVEMDGEG